MKKLKQAYEAGASGQEAPNDARRLRKLAHSLGRNSFEKSGAVNDEAERQLAQKFVDAETLAVGSNKTAFAIIREAAALPHSQTGNPMRGYETIYEDGTKVRKWFTTLSAGAPKNPHLPAEPLLGNAIGTVHVDKLSWSHNGYRIPVDNVTVLCEAPLGRDGEIGSPTTEVTINSRPYDPENIVYTSDGLTGGVRFNVNAEGTVTNTEVTRGNTTSFKPEDLRLGADEFLTQVYKSVQATNAAYGELGAGF